MYPSEGDADVRFKQVLLLLLLLLLLLAVNIPARCARGSSAYGSSVSTCASRSSTGGGALQRWLRLQR